MMNLKAQFRDPGGQIPSNWPRQRIVCNHWPRGTLLRSCQLILICHELSERRVNVQKVAKDATQPNLVDLIHIFLRQRSQSQGNTALPFLADYPDFTEEHPLTTYNSAVATFYAPSDLSGTGGMRKERIRAVSRWRGSHPRFDTVLLKPNSESDSESTSNNKPTINSFSIARVRLFFSFKHNQAFYECALVHDYQVVNPSPDEITGMAIVKRAMRRSLPRARVVPLNDILRAVHLIPVFSQLGTKHIPKKYKHEDTLDDRKLFKQFYVNKFIDHHAFEILS